MDPLYLRWALRAAPSRTSRNLRPCSSSAPAASRKPAPAGHRVMPFLSFASLSFAAIFGFHLATRNPSTTNLGLAHHHTSPLIPASSTTLPIHRFQHTALSNFFKNERITSRIHPAAHIDHACAYPQMAPTNSLHMWHEPPDACDHDGREQGDVRKKPCVAVVLLGWLGAEHRHLKKYADWYMSQGIHALTFSIPMKDIFTLRAEKHVDALSQNLIEWLKDQSSQGKERVVILHMFSNTGWLTYGAVLDRLTKEGDEYVKKIKGCVVDSAPSARNDAQVWASGFAAALLKKKSAAAVQTELQSRDGTLAMHAIKPSMKERALLAMLERASVFVLQTPYVERRLNHVVSVLANKQPPCPQLYVYSSADSVIPVNTVEAFIVEQMKMGHIVRACNFQSSPHVDHFRSHPEKYREQLSSFLKLCLPQNGAPSSECNVCCKGMMH